LKVPVGIFGGLCEGRRIVFFEASEVFVIDEDLGRSWNEREKIGDVSSDRRGS